MLRWIRRARSPCSWSANLRSLVNYGWACSPPLDQRIATRYQLAPMDLAESAQYLRHHLALVGRTDPLFADDAIARLHKASLGLPRALNNAAIAALIAAATAGKALVDDDCAKKAVAELTRD
jgi:type II secretory pathway predicted ATPase ExeA